MDNQVFEHFIQVVEARRSCRNLKSDPLPEGAVEKILAAGRWAMSGANGQPWEFIVVTKPELKERLWEAYRDMDREFIFWTEQMRPREFRHPAFQRPGTIDEQLAHFDEMKGFAHAPALIVVLGDGRRQWATVMGAHTFGRGSTHLTDGLANACQIIHLAATALGLGTQWVTIHVEEEFKQILGIPPLVKLHSIIPVGYPAAAQKGGVRRPLEEIIHYETYDLKKYRSTRQTVEDLAKLRQQTIELYRASVQGSKKE
ncbi:MAG TPA: nitroreductase family protein [Syntrophorhabdales bacterium]|nr:nitroreductase family protein [Syntrophorhabdales bacterium]